MAAVLLKASGSGPARWEQVAREIIDFWVQRSGDELSHTEWDRAQNRWATPGPGEVLAGTADARDIRLIYLREQSEAWGAVLDALRTLQG